MKIIYTLYDYRIKANLSQRALAQISGVGKSTIDRIENGTCRPTVEVICMLAQALNCSPYDLFYVE